MQKLITVYLDNFSYREDIPLFSTKTMADKHGLIEEHLDKYLSDGWKIQSVHGFGAGEGITVKGWFAVVLQKD